MFQSVLCRLCVGGGGRTHPVPRGRSPRRRLRSRAKGGPSPRHLCSDRRHVRIATCCCCWCLLPLPLPLVPVLLLPVLLLPVLLLPVLLLLLLLVMQLCSRN